MRVAPASHAAHIILNIEPLDAFSEHSYVEKMSHWQRQISGYLESNVATEATTHAE